MRARSQRLRSPFYRHSRHSWLRCIRVLVSISAILLIVASCGGEQSIVDPAGPRAQTTATIWWVALALGAVIYLLVVGLLVYALVRRRPAIQPAATDRVGSTTFVLGLGVAMPVVVLAGLFTYTAFALESLSEPEQEPVTTIEIIGHQWWWEVRYPNEGFTTANEIHIPVGQPVALELRTADVIHSFWVPELSGKVDLLPAQTTELWIQADEAGTFRGQCAEFCGIQHANMAFHVVAEPPQAYADWIARQQQPAVQPQDELTSQGLQVFLGASCVYCHTIEGTGAYGEVGPDLTHLSSRQWIAAGTLRMNQGALAAWISDPQHAKPGNFMPATTLSGEDFQALLAYLTSLE